MSLRLSSAKTAPLILDGKKLPGDEEDEDEQFLVEEAAHLPLDVPEVMRVVHMNIMINKNSIKQIINLFYNRVTGIQTRTGR